MNLTIDYRFCQRSALLLRYRIIRSLSAAVTSGNTAIWFATLNSLMESVKQSSFESVMVYLLHRSLNTWRSYTADFIKQIL